MTLTMIPNLLPHEEKLVFFLDQVNVVDVALLSVMNDDAIMNRRAPIGFIARSNYQNSMSATCKSQDMISLVTPGLRG
jgi:hypothetical protein